MAPREPSADRARCRPRVGAGLQHPRPFPPRASAPRRHPHRLAERTRRDGRAEGVSSSTLTGSSRPSSGARPRFGSSWGRPPRITSAPNPPRPCAIAHQDGRPAATVLFEVDGGLISRVDLCIIPPPQTCKGTGIFPGLDDADEGGA